MSNRINISVAREGTIAGAVERSKFAAKISKLDNFITLLDYLEHKSGCPRRGDPYRKTACSCGLFTFLGDADNE